MVNEVDVTVRGHAGHEPTIFKGQGRRSYVRLNVASTPRIRTREGEWSDGLTQWFAVKLFGDLAENAAASIRKGDAVLVRGRLEYEEYDTRDGQRRWSAVIVAESFGPELRHASAHVTRNVRRTGAPEPESEAAGETDASEAGGSAASGADDTGENAGAKPQEEVDTSAFEDFPAAAEGEDPGATGGSDRIGETIAERIA